jgi:hypothetical protein
MDAAAPVAERCAAGLRNFRINHAYSGCPELRRGNALMADKVAEYRRTAQMLRLLAEQSRFPDTGEQLRRLASSFDTLADRVGLWDQKGERSSANAA